MQRFHTGSFLLRHENQLKVNHHSPPMQLSLPPTKNRRVTPCSAPTPNIYAKPRLRECVVSSSAKHRWFLDAKKACYTCYAIPHPSLSLSPDTPTPTRQMEKEIRRRRRRRRLFDSVFAHAPKGRERGCMLCQKVGILNEFTCEIIIFSFANYCIVQI